MVLEWRGARVMGLVTVMMKTLASPTAGNPLTGAEDRVFVGVRIYWSRNWRSSWQSPGTMVASVVVPWWGYP